MRRITDIRELDWFNIQNYKVLIDLSLSDFVGQLERRAWLWTDPHLWDDWEHEEFLEAITTGKTVDTGAEPNKIEMTESTVHEHSAPGLSPLDTAVQLNYTAAINPVSVIDLQCADGNAREAGLYKGLGDDSITLQEHVLSSISALDIKGPNYSVMTFIHLDDFTDEEILSDLRWLLPRWREQMGVEERETSKRRMGAMTFIKIIKQRLIPLLDLMLWGRRSMAKISNDHLARKLFDGADGETKGEEHMKKVILPFLQEAVTDAFLKDLRHYLNENSYLKSRLVKDHMQIMSKK